MQDIAIAQKRNSKHEWHFPRAVEVLYPSKIGSIEDRQNWIAAMILDSRLGDRDKVVLTRLALHLNLETKRLDPSMDLLALETSLSDNQASGRRMARRCIAWAERLGWIERTGRHAGHRFNRSNSYRLRVPKDLRPDKSDWSSGQIERVDRTPQSGRIGKVNREQIYKRGTFEGRLATRTEYTPEDLRLVRDILAENPLTVNELIRRAKVDSLVLGQMAVDREIEFEAGYVSAPRSSMSEGSKEVKP
jgi:hypothetical protein